MVAMTEQDLASLAPLDALRRLRLQVDNAINYIESGMPMIEDHHLGHGKDQRLLWEIGDFVIMARFSGSNPPFKPWQKQNPQSNPSGNNS